MSSGADQAVLLLLEQAELARDAARSRAQQATEAARQAHARTEQLVAYRDDYRRRAPALGGRSASMELVRCHQGFMARLDQALEQQRAQLANLEQHAATQRQSVLELERRVAAVKKLIERRHDERQRLAHRAEQRHTDEAALRLVMHRAAFERQ